MTSVLLCFSFLIFVFGLFLFTHVPRVLCSCWQHTFLISNQRSVFWKGENGVSFMLKSRFKSSKELLMLLLYKTQKCKISVFCPGIESKCGHATNASKSEP